jgi:pyridoxal phosphate enzyme (YggS family)
MAAPETPEVSELVDRIRRNLANVRARIAAAAERAGRDPAGVALLPVTKMQDAPTTAALLQAGIYEIGENRVQDALRKADLLGAAAGKFRWQLIGHLQTNKVRKALTLFCGLHSLDSVRLAEALERELAARHGESSLRVYVEVNTSAEEAKTGAAEGEAREILGRLAECPHLVPAGLMTMGPLSPDPEDARSCFRRLRELLGSFRDAGLLPADCAGLSMGMSGDFEVAVEEGATVVRVGTAVFK